MQTCEHCPYPARCEMQQRCIRSKINATPVELPEPMPVPVKTSNGIGMTGKIKLERRRYPKMPNKKYTGIMPKPRPTYANPASYEHRRVITCREGSSSQGSQAAPEACV